MVSSILKQAAEIMRKRKEGRKWQKVVLCLALVAVVGTITVLMTTGRALTDQDEYILTCEYEVHEHTDDCKDDDGKIVCGFEDFVIHEHNDYCFNEKGELVCKLPEIELHEHEETCYSHDPEVAPLVCGIVTDAEAEIAAETETVKKEQSSSNASHNSGSSSGTEEVLTCGKSEHTHSSSCETTKDVLDCSSDEEGHEHSGGCYKTETESCGKEEHTHSADCYSTVEKSDSSADDAEPANVESVEPVAESTESGEANDSSSDETLTEPVDNSANSDAADGAVDNNTDNEDTVDGTTEVTIDADAELEVVEDPEHVHTEECYKLLICEETAELHEHINDPDDENCCYDSDAYDDETGEFIEGSRPVCGKKELKEHVHTEKCLTANTVILEKEFTGELESGKVHVVVSYTGKAGIPDDAELLVEQITEKSSKDLYEKRAKAADELAQWPEEAEDQLYRVGFYAGEEEIRPEADVDIEFTLYQEDVTEENLLGVVSFAKDAAQEDIKAADKEDKGLSVELTDVSTGEFLFGFEGLDGVFKKEYTGEYEGGTFKVIATYGKDAKIPKKAKLVVEAIDEESNKEEYKEKTDAVKELTGYEEASAEILFDIGFYVGKKEIEPKATVALEFQLYDKSGIVAGEPVTVVHFGDEAKLLDSTDMSKNEDGSLSTSFESDSFSPFMMIVGGGETRTIGLIGGDMTVYVEADRESESYDLNTYEPELEERVRIQVLESLTDDEGEEWYRYKTMTEDEKLKKLLEGYPYIPAKDVVSEEEYVKQVLTATDEEGVKITVEGFLPKNAKLSVKRIYDPEIADVAETIEADLPDEDIGDFRLVYDLGIGVDKALPWPATVTVSNFDLYYYDYDNLASWVYQIDSEVEKMEAETKTEGAVRFQTGDFSTFYVAMALIEGREEYFNGLAEFGDEIELWDFEEILENMEPAIVTYGMQSMGRAADQTSESQIHEYGEEKTSQDGVTYSKKISGTNQENVFDITLEVTTTENIQQLTTDPDAAVVIVMDISNTMNYGMGGKTRYQAAMEAASGFIDLFQGKCVAGSRSRIGFVAFNTDSRQIFGMSQCCTTQQATDLKSKMQSETNKIIGATGYGDSHSRFTNVEAGLKQAQDMLGTVTNRNKYIIFLSDGFPTTYLKNRNGTNYKGYDPYTSSGTVGADGVFHDDVRNVYCDGGTSYSDKAAIRARERAVLIKNSGIKIFSVGIDIGGQTIKFYIDAMKDSNYAIVDRTSTNYEIGSASSSSAYTNWLENKIGSGEGYYFGSTDYTQLIAALNNIFDKIKNDFESSSQSVWVVEDPIPTISDGGNDKVEFISFYQKDNRNMSNPSTELKGAYVEGGENTADCTSNKITWDLKNSGYSSTTSNNGKITTYKYTLKYRVRLENEESGFGEGTIYKTNGKTTLTYQVTKTSGGKTTVSDPTKVEFKSPSVEGYLTDLEFQKVDRTGKAIAGAEFTLTHDSNCKVCRGNNTRVKVDDKKATSDANGNVKFTNIPSGHKYILTETKVPAGHYSYGESYKVVVAYDEKTITVVNATDAPVQKTGWDGKVVNGTIFELPETGGPGVSDYMKAGIFLMFLAMVSYFGYARRKGMKRE